MSEISSSPNGLHIITCIPSINSSVPAYMYCFITSPGSLIYTTLYIINIVVLFPLCIFIIHHGVQEWQKRCSTSSSASMSHSDCFTYHMVVMELIGVCGCLICCCGIYREDFNIIRNAYFPFNLNYFGQACFHVLTCVERYLAVMHPITYLSLRQERGIRIRNTIIGCVWMLCFVSMALVVRYKVNAIAGFCIIALTLAVISFCSLSVLWALIRPGPGEQGGDRKRADRSKQRAFYTIVVILGMLVLKFASGLVWAASFASGGNHDCIMMTSIFWFYLPSSLVLPLMFLHRAGKLSKTPSEDKSWTCCITTI